MEPDRTGELRNTGTVPVLIHDAVKSGPQAGEYNFYLEYNGDVFRPYELPDRAPIELRPGEKLDIRGRFLPGADAGGDNTPRIAQIDFATNAPTAPTVTVAAAGYTVSTDAAGAWMPTTINFGNVDINLSNHPMDFPTRNCLIESTGPTSLLIYSFEFEDPNIGFSYTVESVPQPGQTVTPGVSYQIPSGDSMILHIRFVPSGFGEVETNLVAHTNVGPLPIRLIGEGVR
jgi:hypothetical protein